MNIDRLLDDNSILIQNNLFKLYQNYRSEMMEQTVTFQNPFDNTIIGILHIPENQQEVEGRIGVNILNPGLKNRVAPNRLNVKIARMLCKKGFYVLRVDPTGIGDSEGQLCENNENVLNMWRMIQQGTFVQDTISSNNFFIETCKLDDLTLIGQCGAGVTALLCGGRDHRIKKLILIDMPFRVVSSDMNQQGPEEDWVEMGDFIKSVSRVFYNPMKLKMAIQHCFSGRSFLNTISFIAKFLYLNDKNRNMSNLSERFNWKAAKAFESFIRRNGKINFVFAENDFSLKEFKQDFEPNFLYKSENYRMNFKIRIIKDANHIYSEIKWQEELLGIISTWMGSQ